MSRPDVLDLLSDSIKSCMMEDGVTSSERQPFRDCRGWNWNNIDRMQTSKNMHPHYIDIAEAYGGLGTVVVLAYHIASQKCFLRRSGGANSMDRAYAMDADRTFEPDPKDLADFYDFVIRFSDTKHEGSAEGA